jgi:GR25 family glycosyltransferase involved in LPS biosynthesis
MKNIRTFVIALRDLPSRVEYIINQCNKNNINFEIFDAINGQKLGLLPEHCNKLEFPDYNVKINSGGVGCALSHYILWNLLKYLPEEEFLILEDDCIFCEEFPEKFEELYKKLPSDWEMVYVGWIIYGNDISPVKVAEGISVRIPSATHAYMVKKSALKKLTDALHPISSPIDLQIIDKALPYLKYYVLDPSLVAQRSYLNFKESDWISSGYNWDLDLYGVKRKLSREFRLLEGWYGLEKDNNSSWRWSHSSFKMMISRSKKIKLVFASPTKNLLTININDVYFTEEILVEGENEIDIEISKILETNVILVGHVKDPFIPCERMANSTDSRKLGICLRRIEVEVNNLTTIPIDVSRIFIK